MQDCILSPKQRAFTAIVGSTAAATACFEHGAFSDNYNLQVGLCLVGTACLGVDMLASWQWMKIESLENSDALKKLSSAICGVILMVFGIVHMHDKEVSLFGTAVTILGAGFFANSFTLRALINRSLITPQV